MRATACSTSPCTSSRTERRSSSFHSGKIAWSWESGWLNCFFAVLRPSSAATGGAENGDGIARSECDFAGYEARGDDERAMVEDMAESKLERTKYKHNLASFLAPTGTRPLPERPQSIMDRDGAVQDTGPGVLGSGAHDMDEKTPLLKKKAPRKPEELKSSSTAKTGSRLIHLVLALTLVGALWGAQIYYPVTDPRPYAICARRKSTIYTVDAARPIAQCILVNEHGRIADIGSAGAQNLPLYRSQVIQELSSGSQGTKSPRALRIHSPRRDYRPWPSGQPCPSAPVRLGQISRPFKLSIRRGGGPPRAEIHPGSTRYQGRYHGVDRGCRMGPEPLER